MRETTCTYLAAIPSKTVQAWGCAFGGFSESAPTSIHRLEPPAATSVIVLCCGEPLTLQGALTGGSTSRLYAFSAGLQVQAQRVLHAGINDCVEIRLPPLASYALFGGAMAESNREPVSLLDIAPQPISILLDQLRDMGTWQHRLAAVNRFLQHGFAESKCRIPPELTWAWETLERSHAIRRASASDFTKFRYAAVTEARIPVSRRIRFRGLKNHLLDVAESNNAFGR